MANPYPPYPPYGGSPYPYDPSYGTPPEGNPLLPPQMQTPVPMPMLKTDGPPGTPAGGSPQPQSATPPAMPGPNIGPTDIPPKEDPTHPDLYFPPYDASNPPEKQSKLRYDPKTGTYVAIAQWNSATKTWRVYDQKEFKKFNEGSKAISPSSDDTEKTIGNTTYIVRKDPKTQKDVIIGVKFGGKIIYVPNEETANRAAGLGGIKLGDIPPPSSEFMAPPMNADGSSPAVQYVFRLNKQTGMFVRVAEIHNNGDQSTRKEYTQEEFLAANASVDNNWYPDLPPPDPDHPDFTAKDTNAHDRKIIYRWIDGKYQMAGYQIGKQTLYFHGQSRDDINKYHTPPKPRPEKTLADLPQSAADPMDDKVIPPAGQPDTTSYCFRYDPGTDTWYMIGEYKTDSNGVSTWRDYDEAEFKEKNKPGDAPSTNQYQKGDYQIIGTNLIARKDPKTEQVTIVGIAAGGATYYFESKSFDLINADGNVKGPQAPINPATPTDTIPAQGEGARHGHPDFNSKDPDNPGPPQKFIIWRWDTSVGAYCAVGEYSEDPENTKSLKLHMYTNTEYQKKNTGPDRLLPPPSKANYTMPKYSDEEVNYDQAICLVTSPGASSTTSEESDVVGITGYPIYAKLANGDKVIIGISIHGDGETVKRYFSQEEFEYYNPGGKATGNHDVVHNKPNDYAEWNNPTFDFMDNTSGYPTESAYHAGK